MLAILDELSILNLAQDTIDRIRNTSRRNRMNRNPQRQSESLESKESLLPSLVDEIIIKMFYRRYPSYWNKETDTLQTDSTPVEYYFPTVLLPWDQHDSILTPRVLVFVETNFGQYNSNLEWNGICLVVTKTNWNPNPYRIRTKTSTIFVKKGYQIKGRGIVFDWKKQTPPSICLTHVERIDPDLCEKWMTLNQGQENSRLLWKVKGHEFWKTGIGFDGTIRFLTGIPPTSVEKNEMYLEMLRGMIFEQIKEIKSLSHFKLYPQSVKSSELKRYPYVEEAIDSHGEMNQVMIPVIYSQDSDRKQDQDQDQTQGFLMDQDHQKKEIYTIKDLTQSFLQEQFPKAFGMQTYILMKQNQPKFESTVVTTKVLLPLYLKQTPSESQKGPVQEDRFIFFIA